MIGNFAAKKIDVPWKTFYYYGNSLYGDRREAYRCIRKGLTTWQSRIEVPGGIDLDQMYDIYTYVIRDTPIFFHVSNLMKFRYGAVRSEVFPDYCMSPQEFERISAQIKQFAYRSRQMTLQENGFEKARILHSSMARHIIYKDKEDPNSHNIIGAILHRKSVCEGISKSFKLLCDFSLVPCIVVYGDATDNGNWNGALEKHAWNMIRLDGKWFNVDVTYDAGLSDYANTRLVRYDYFMRSDRVFSFDHRPNPGPRPACPQDFSLYRARGDFARSVSDVLAIFQRLGPGNPRVVFEYDPSVRDPDALIKEALNRSRLGEIWINHNKVLRVFVITYIR